MHPYKKIIQEDPIMNQPIKEEPHRFAFPNFRQPLLVQEPQQFIPEEPIDILVSQDIQVEDQEKEVLSENKLDLSPIKMHAYDIQDDRLDLLQQKEEVINEEL